MRLSLCLLCGLVACAAGATDASDLTDDSDGPVQTDDTDQPEPGPFRIEVQLPGADWESASERFFDAPSRVAVRLAPRQTDDPIFDEITEVTWLWDDAFVRDREGPPWQPHPDTATWIDAPREVGLHLLCAHAVRPDGVDEECINVGVEPPDDDPALPDPPALVDEDSFTVGVNGGRFQGRCIDCATCEDDLELTFGEVVTGPIHLSGYRNIVAIGGTLDLTADDTPDHGVHLEGTCGVAHLEGMKITGAGLLDAVRVDAPNAHVRIFASHLDVRPASANGPVDGVQVTASASTHLQALTVLTASEGVDLSPPDGQALGRLTLRSIAVVGQDSTALRVRYATAPTADQVWLDDPVRPCEERTDLDEPDDEAWVAISCGEAPDDVGADPSTVGLGYRR